jgi:type II secretory pathway component PulF
MIVLSNFFRRQGAKLILIFLIQGLMFFYFYKKSDHCKIYSDKMLLKLPLIGRILGARALMRWFTGLAMAVYPSCPIIFWLVIH